MKKIYYVLTVEQWNKYIKNIGYVWAIVSERYSIQTYPARTGEIIVEVIIENPYSTNELEKSWFEYYEKQLLS